MTDTALRLPRPARAVACAMAAAAFAFPAAVPAEQNVDLRVSIATLAVCRMQSVRDVNFGALDPAQAVNARGEGTIAFFCTRGVDYRLDIDNGQNFDPVRKLRQMRGPGEHRLPYALAQSTFTGIGLGFGNPVVVTMVATIQGADYRNLPAAAYTDVLRVTLEP